MNDLLKKRSLQMAKERRANDQKRMTRFDVGADPLDLSIDIVRHGAVELRIPSAARLTVLDKLFGSFADFDIEDLEHVQLFAYVCECPDIAQVAGRTYEDLQPIVAGYFDNIDSRLLADYAGAITRLLYCLKKNFMASQRTILQHVLQTVGSWQGLAN